MAIAYEPARDRVADAVASAAVPWVNPFPVTEESFGELLRRLRDRAGYSQEAFADAVELSRKTIYSIENERGRPRFQDEVAVVTKMAEVLGQPVAVLSSKLGWLPVNQAEATWMTTLTDEQRELVLQLIHALRKAEPPPKAARQQRAARS